MTINRNELPLKLKGLSTEAQMQLLNQEMEKLDDKLEIINHKEEKTEKLVLRGGFVLTEIKRNIEEYEGIAEQIKNLQKEE